MSPSPLTLHMAHSLLSYFMSENKLIPADLVSKIFFFLILHACIILFAILVFIFTVKLENVSVFDLFYQIFLHVIYVVYFTVASV